MAQALRKTPRLTVVEYLDGEKRAAERHEFFRGHVYAMAGTTLRHSDIKMNLTSWLRDRLPKGCGLYNGDVKLMIESGDETSVYYPDVFMSCGKRDPSASRRTGLSSTSLGASPSPPRAWCTSRRVAPAASLCSARTAILCANLAWRAELRASSAIPARCA